MHQRLPSQLDGSWAQGTKRLKSPPPARSVTLDATGLLSTSPIKCMSKESTRQVRKDSIAENKVGLLMRVSVIRLCLSPVSSQSTLSMLCFGRNSVVFLPFLDLWDEIQAEWTVRTLRSKRQSQTFSPSHAFPGSWMDNCHLNAIRVCFNVFKYQWNVLSNSSRLLIYISMKFLIN